MKHRSVFVFLAAGAVLLCLTAGAIAQKPTEPKKPGLMGRMMGRARQVVHGNVVGNKNTKVYHLPGDKSALPAEKNRVYFKSAKEAEAAGYHRAGVKAIPVKKGPARDPKTGKFIKSPGR